MRRSQQKGFSLIEIMAVVFVVAIAFGMATFMFSDKEESRKLEKAISRFALMSQHASEMSSIKGEAFGLIFEPPAWREDPFTQGWRYRWQQLTIQGWQDVEAMEPVELPLQVDVRILIEGQEWEYDEPPKDQKALVPIIGFFPGGDVTPFEIEITHREMDIESQHIGVDEWGDIVWLEHAEAEKEARELAEDF